MCCRKRKKEGENIKIGIVELHYHEEYIHTLLKIFPDDTTLFITDKVYKNLHPKDKMVANIQVCNRQPIKKFINNINTEDFDYIFVNTIQPSMVDIPKWKNFNPKCPSILTIHNINAWSEHGPHFKKNILHTADSFVASFYSNRIINKFTYLNVVNESLLLSANKKFPDKDIFSIPFSVANDTVKTDEKKTIDFVIPGTVDSRRRDYETVLDVFDVLQRDYKNIRLILLGKCDQNIKQKNVITFNKYVSKVEYDEYLRNSDFIITSSHPSTSTVNTATEIYGLTKSPNIFEAIKWRKPLIIPREIPVPKSIIKSTILYDNYEELYEQMHHYVKYSDERDKIKDIAYQNSDYYTVENVKRRIKKWIKEI